MGDVNWSELLTDYCGSTRPGALVVIGEWGSGKTHLYLNELRSSIANLNRRDLYVSLYSYGVNSKLLDDFIIEEYLGLEDIDASTKEGAKGILTSVLSEWSSEKKGGMAATAVSVIGGAVKKRIIKGLDEFIFCFDDVDRVRDAKLVELWSEINYFVEFKRRKVILLLDETRLPTKSIYTPDFEKNVWGAIRLNMSSESALEHAYRLLGRELYDSIEMHKVKFLVVAQALGINNIRVLHMALDSLRLIRDEVDRVDDEISTDLVAALYQFIFFGKLIYSIKGSVAGRILKLFDTGLIGFKTKLKTALYFSNDANDNDLSEDERFIEKLPDFHFGRFSFGFAVSYFESGYIDSDAIRRLVTWKVDTSDIHPREEVVSFIRYRWRYSDEEYLKAFDCVVDFISNPPDGHYDFSQYWGLIGSVYFDASNGGVSYSASSVSKKILRGMGLFKKKMASQKIVLVDEHPRVFDGQGRPDEILKIANEICQDADFLLQVKKARNELAGWQSEPSQLSHLSNNYNVPVLELMGKAEVYGFLKDCDGEGLRYFLMFVCRRFEAEGNLKFSEAEIRILEGVYKYCARYKGKGFKKVQCTSNLTRLNEVIANAKRHSVKKIR